MELRSPDRDLQQYDEECGGERGGEDICSSSDAFDIPAKNVPFERLRRWRVKGLSDMLKTNIDRGISGDDSEVLHRRNIFGANTYPQKKGRNFLVFVWEACQDLTLVILMVAAVISLVLGIQTEVIRGGRRFEVSIFDLVVGDVVPLKIGDQVSADGILISGHSLAIDESSMTGEAKIVHKDQKNPFLMSGCKVADGYGTMLVTSVGINTEWGLLMATISEDNGEETPLQVRLNGVATFIGIIGLTVAASVLVVLLARYFTGHTKNPDGTVQFIRGQTGVRDALNGAIKILTVAVTIVVVAVPEGLPLAVTLTLAYSMRKMMADKALVRRLSACETMGSATTICSDKTGTLTLNQMTVVEAYVGGMKLDNPNDVKELCNVSPLLIEGIAQNTTGDVFEPEDGGALEVTGSPTEKAILSWGVKLGMKFNDVRSKSSILHVFPFNSEKKRGGVAIQLINEFKKSIEDMAAVSLRCVVLAYRLYDLEKVPNEEQRDTWELPEDELILLGIVGIKVRMVTGDNIQTAKAIALECGILDSDANATEPTIIEGKAFRALSETAREAIAERITVMGRSSPNDKLLLVQALRKKGHIVAVTGDGTNDAPALHEADIGLAMGIQGTEVAKESSDIIILDDNFASVVKVVRWGRSVYANIQKFIQFQLTVNVAALVINVVAAVSSGNVPLNAVQALYQVVILLTFNFGGRSILHMKGDTLEHAEKAKNTFVFNTFVLCQIFNEFNARKPDEKNVFHGVTKNRLFMGIIGITVLLQILIIEFLGHFTSTVRLNWKLWLFSIAIAFVSWPLALVGKFIPVPQVPFRDYIFRYRRNEQDERAEMH
ncbi:Calcium-transporting ATPase 5, plasma membrane-type [Cocos nucifera]|uniref:Calcium-transporting ATPase 5, plasma membrane-type n=1 Tax=Cocos nucifera TaxID=13894 RepID=A0A8K0I0X9_COCNU|nr:Calcium-transporting ATPase 5, plasma membrane-type [Cocos nucifera]